MLHRYRGTSPKNYVTFNNEVWRIIGVFPTDDGTGNIENRIKIVRDKSVVNQYWNTKQVASTSSYNNWTGATLMTYLNSSYINTLDINEAYGLIDNVKYYLGGYSEYRITVETMYNYERKMINTKTNEFYYGTNPNSWIGKIGLMYASDYGYASANCETYKLYNGNTATDDLKACNDTNWLYNLKENEWLLPQKSEFSADAYYIRNSGEVSNYSTSNNGVNKIQRLVRPTLYLKSEVQITEGDGTSSNPYKLSFTKNEDTSNANAPVLASNMIPVYYDGTDKVWKKADVKNKAIENRWYNYENHMWANAVTVKEANRTTYLNAKVGTEIPMTDINTMWVWIPRFNAGTPSNYNGGTKVLPNAIDVTFVKPNETALDAFTFGTKQLSGFWYGKFELSHTTLVSNTTANNLGCTNETCTNANNILIKPSVTILRYNNISNFFFASRSMEQTGNSFGLVSSEVDTHMSKNNEWGAVAYLTQSIYGRCTSSTLCVEIGINNNSTYKTGYGAPAGTSSTSSTTNTYDTTVGMEASTTGNIYGIYDMAGGLFEYVMGVYNKTTGNSGFTTSTFPNEKYYNNYTATTYQGHALTETQGWYNDIYSFVSSSSPWFVRGATVANVDNNGIFSAYGNDGGSNGYRPTRFTLTNE